MSIKSKTVFKLELKHSILFWGCEYGSEGEDKYQDYIIPFNIGDSVTKDDKQYKVTEKDWDYDNNTVYFTLTKV